MAFNDDAVFTAATGYVYTGAPGTPAPTPEQIRDFNPDTFAAVKAKVTAKGTEDFTLTVKNKSTGKLKATATAAEVQAALEALDTVGAQGVVVTGDTAKTGLTVAYTGSNHGEDLQLNGDTNVTVVSDEDIAGWSPIGHTHREELPEFGYEGGETEMKGSWQKKNLRENVSEQPVDYVGLKLIQLDENTLEYYYGRNASKEKGVFGVDGSAAASVERAILIVLVDGDNRLGFSAAKASIRRDEALSLASDDFTALPIRATFVKHPGRLLLQWIFQADKK